MAASAESDGETQGAARARARDASSLADAVIVRCDCGSFRRGFRAVEHAGKAIARGAPQRRKSAGIENTLDMKIALLHLAPSPGAVRRNQNLIETALQLAADSGAEWAVTPELATTGYGFSDIIGTNWIERQPDGWVRSIAAFAGNRRLAVFLSVPERGETKLFNTVIAIDRTGRIVGRHSKINTLSVGAEAWSSAGPSPEAVRLDDFGPVGVLVCADACSPSIAQDLAARGARALVSSAAWPPGRHGPDGEWEAVSKATSLPVFVCNRTGWESVLDFTLGESVVAFGGRRVVSLASATSSIFLVDWDFSDHRLIGCVQILVPSPAANPG